MHLSRVFLSFVSIGVLLFSSGVNIAQDKGREQLWDAVRKSDPKAVTEALDKGADVNAKNEIGVTALWIATSKGKLDLVELLVKRGADVNARDGIWYQTPLSNSISRGQTEIAKFLIQNGATNINPQVVGAASTGKHAILKLLLETGKVTQDVLDAALLATAASNTEIRETLTKAGAKTTPKITEDERKALTPLTGAFEGDNGAKITFEVTDYGLAAKRAGSPVVLKPLGNDVFQPAGSDATYHFKRDDDKASRVTMKMFTAEHNLFRFETREVAKNAGELATSGVVTSAANWPSFRGLNASGSADGQHPPATWDVKAGTNVLWKTPIPGLGHSCPVVWGNHVFVTTAISENPNPTLRIGNYGDVASVNDTTKHTWQTICLDRLTGKILWTKTAFEGVPKIKRHLKGSQANCTNATDGKHVISCFGSEGLYCYDFTGKLLWKRDLGELDSSFVIDQKYEWGFGSSPVIFDDLVILQCDLGKDSFIAAYRLEDGYQVWSTPRDEIASWSSPTIWRTKNHVELVTNASQFARGYDPATGKELWRLAKKSEATIPTPIFNQDFIFLTSGNRPIQPIYAIRPGAKGDISLGTGVEQNEHIAWSKQRGGPYMPTPILYGDYLYLCGNSGIVTCYEAKTGKEVYRERLGGNSYTASPVAADGRIYFTAEQGDIRVIKAGPRFELLAVNNMDDICMATPAISGGCLFVRSQHFLYALGKKSMK